MLSELHWTKVEKLGDSLTRVPILEAVCSDCEVKLLVDTEHGHLIMAIDGEAFTTMVDELVVSALVALKPALATELATVVPEEPEDEPVRA